MFHFDKRLLTYVSDEADYYIREDDYRYAKKRYLIIKQLSWRGYFLTKYHLQSEYLDSSVSLLNPKIHQIVECCPVFLSKYV